MREDADPRLEFSSCPCLQAQADRDLGHRSVVAMLAVFAMVPMVAYGTSVAALHPGLFRALLLSVLGLGAFRVLLVLGWRRSSRPEAPGWIAGLQLSIILGGLLWSAILVRIIYLQGLYDWNSMVLLMVLLGVGGGSVATMMSHYWLLALHVGVCILPVAASAVLLGGPRGYAIGSGFVVVAAYLLIQGRVLNRHYWQGLKDNRRLQASLRELEIARAAAESASRAKSLFLDNMSHELRTPLNGVLGMLELMDETDLDAEQREYCQMARSAGMALSSLVTDVLDYSTLEADDIRLSHAEFTLTRLVSRIHTSFAHLLRDRPELRLTFDISPDLPDHLSGDEERLKQILCRLIGNALKFSTRGEIQVRIKPGEVGPKGIELNIEVQDCGIGIEPGLQQEIFKPFVQADCSLARRMGGMGLGLAICQRLVHKMGGAMSVVSAPGAGSCFRFSVVMEARNRVALNQQERIPA